MLRKKSSTVRAEAKSGERVRQAPIEFLVECARPLHGLFGADTDIEHFRVMKDQANRALAGLSMGAGQAWQIGTAIAKTAAPASAQCRMTELL